MSESEVVGSMNVPLQIFAGATEIDAGLSSGDDRADRWKRLTAWFRGEHIAAVRWAGDPVVVPPRMAFSTPRSDLGVEPATFPSRKFDLRDGILLGTAMVGMAALLMTAASGAYSITGSGSAATRVHAAIPSDPTIGGRLLAAQDLVADRETDGLERAIGLLEGVTMQAPGFAPGHAGLAEALVLSREFGRRNDMEAFRQARQAALTAVRLDPELAAGHRLLGFMDYWADGDFARARLRFERALELDRGDVLSHFWYGNVLSDHGDHAAAMAELERALVLQPGSVAIRTDLAWARWSVGEDAAARAALNEIVREDPDFAVAHDCLAIMALVDGDTVGYLHHFTMFARSRGDARLLLRADELARASTAGPGALRRAVLAQAQADVADGSHDRVWPVMVASLEGDRGTVLRLLRAARGAHEHWGDAALQMRIRAIWKGDREIMRLIGERTA
ncbi:tetratricopeptide repeat protein [Novosphingobium kaempferiae]|uniref:tetratricopeptide repeat protein n=1 Tax=Novosphingobium kaempferiae TaxID=2896849 RepID=UPI001E449EBB|nr:tetratricopeptide repeat protein [Novosphingobium kaempferiae]